MSQGYIGYHIQQSIQNELKKQNLTMIIITHEMDFAYTVADKVIVIEKGEIIEEKDVK